MLELNFDSWSEILRKFLYWNPSQRTKQSLSQMTDPLRIIVIRLSVFVQVISEENQGWLMATLDACREGSEMEDKIMCRKRLQKIGWTRNAIDCGDLHGCWLLTMNELKDGLARILTFIYPGRGASRKDI